MMKVNTVTSDVTLEVAPCYCSQAGRSVNKKEKFYELVGKVMTSEKVLVDMWVFMWVVLESLAEVLGK